MRKMTLLSPVILISVVLLGCQNNATLSVDQNHDLVNPTTEATLEDLLIEVDTERIATLLLAGESMVIYLGNPFCASCQALKPNLEQYLINYQPVMYHFNHLINDNISTYADLVVDFPQIFNPQIQTPSFYFIQRNQLLFHYQNPTQEFLEYRSFEAIMNYRMTVNKAIVKNKFIDQGWVLVKAFENSTQSIQNITALYNHFSNQTTTLSWMDHEAWNQWQDLSLNQEFSHLIKLNNDAMENYNLNVLSQEELMTLISN
jgi:thiol-disulfide isomerase/thioredoxin